MPFTVLHGTSDVFAIIFISSTDQNLSTGEIPADEWNEEGEENPIDTDLYLRLRMQ